MFKRFKFEDRAGIRLRQNPRLPSSTSPETSAVALNLSRANPIGAR